MSSRRPLAIPGGPAEDLGSAPRCRTHLFGVARPNPPGSRTVPAALRARNRSLVGVPVAGWSGPGALCASSITTGRSSPATNPSGSPAAAAMSSVRYDGCCRPAMARTSVLLPVWRAPCRVDKGGSRNASSKGGCRVSPSHETGEWYPPCGWISTTAWMISGQAGAIRGQFRAVRGRPSPPHRAVTRRVRPGCPPAGSRRRPGRPASSPRRRAWGPSCGPVADGP